MAVTERSKIIMIRINKVENASADILVRMYNALYCNVSDIWTFFQIIPTEMCESNRKRFKDINGKDI